jgi:formamidopyrimidine-DNA glycosylase
MPELPDLEVFKQYFDATALYQPIDRVEVRDDIILEDIPSGRLESALTGHSFSSTRRHGKYLFTEIGDHWLAWHFGMTGRLEYFKDPAAEPEYVPLLIRFSNGYHLAYVMARKLGQIELVESVEQFVTAHKLGPDVLQPEFDLAAFRLAVSGRRGMVKTTLMNQEIMAGIGNVYSDEILFQAGIHPKTKIGSLADDGLEHLFETMKRVLQTAIDEYRADPDRFPRTWLTPHRQEGEKCPGGEGRIERLKVSGRSAYYCSARQKLN